MTLRMFWHQWVGLVEIVMNLMHYRNLLLMDSVGVGKTMQATAAITYSFHLQQTQKKLPPTLGKSLIPLGVQAQAPADGQTDGWQLVHMPASQDTLKPLVHLIVVPPGLLAQWMLELHRNLQLRAYWILPYTGVWKANNREPFFRVLDSNWVETILLVSSLALVSDACTVLKPSCINKQMEFDILLMAMLVDPMLKNNNFFGPNRKFDIVIINKGDRHDGHTDHHVPHGECSACG